MAECLQSWRDQAMSQFREAGLPHNEQEAWKYTDISDIHRTMGPNWRKREIHATGDFVPESYPHMDGLDGYTIVFYRGRIHLGKEPMPVGIDIVAWSMMDEGTVCERLVKPQPEAPLFHAFDALNAALFQDGLCVRIAAGISMEKPLYLVHLHDGVSHNHVRHSVYLGEGATANIINHDVAVNDQSEQACLGTSHWHCYLEASSTLHHTRIQQLPAKDWHVGRIYVKQQQGSRFYAHAAELGGAKVRMDIDVQLQQADAYCAVNGLFLLHGKQHVDHHIHIAHHAPDCNSRQVYRSVLNDHSHGVFNGKVHVHAHASGTDAKQHSDNLLLSRHAEIDTKPELEIDHDNVKCSHGATVGQLNAEHLFYLRSRGLPESMAREILVFAFADALLVTLPDKSVRSYIEDVAFDKLPHAVDLMGLLTR